MPYTNSFAAIHEASLTAKDQESTGQTIMNRTDKQNRSWHCIIKILREKLSLMRSHKAKTGHCPCNDMFLLNTFTIQF